MTNWTANATLEGGSRRGRVALLHSGLGGDRSVLEIVSQILGDVIGRVFGQLFQRPGEVVDREIGHGGGGHDIPNSRLSDDRGRDRIASTDLFRPETFAAPP